MSEKQNNLTQKKEYLSKKLQEHSVAKQNAKLERTKGLICTLVAGALLAGIVGQVMPFVETMITTLTAVLLGSVGTVIYSRLQLPKQTETDALSKEIAEIEKELGFCNEKV